ncbi:hypothetical protein TNCV_32911 [Trichonephila clavipes]|nr:hypothetical protein TNCV_32911 [Trichonephila clavipes]
MRRYPPAKKRVWIEQEDPEESGSKDCSAITCGPHSDSFNDTSRRRNSNCSTNNLQTSFRSKLNPPSGQHGFFCPTKEASKTDHTEFFLHSLFSTQLLEGFWRRTCGRGTRWSRYGIMVGMSRVRAQCHKRLAV